MTELKLIGIRPNNLKNNIERILNKVIAGELEKYRAGKSERLIEMELLE